MIDPITWEKIEKPLVWDDYGIPGPYPFLRIDEDQGLNPTQQQMGRSNLGLPSDFKIHDPLTLGTQNGLSLSGQQLSLNLATDSSSGAMSSDDKKKLSGGNLVSGGGINLTGTAIGRLLSSGDLSVSVDATVLRTSLDQVKTGLLTTRRAGSNNGSSPKIVERWDIGNDNLYKLDLVNTQNVQDTVAEVQWFFSFTSNVSESTSIGIPKSRDMIGFTRGAVTILGGRALPESYYLSIVTDEGNHDSDPDWRYPLRTFAYGVTQAEGLIVGSSDNLVGQINSNTRLFVDGAIKTSPTLTAPSANWKLGDAYAGADNTVNRYVRVEINGVEVDLLGRVV